MEVWKSIDNYEGLYEVSNMGRVRSFYKGCKILKGFKDKDGYNIVDLYKDGIKKKYRVARLVGFAFVEGYFEGAEIDHIIPIRNSGTDKASNLRWVTSLENTHNPLTEENYAIGNGNKNYKHSEETKRKIIETSGDKVICIETGIPYSSIREASRETGVNRYSIMDCLKGKQKTAGGYHWKKVT